MAFRLKAEAAGVCRAGRKAPGGPPPGVQAALTPSPKPSSRLFARAMEKMRRP
jgi:hypothetical protein